MRKNKNERFLAENITVSNDTRVTGLNNNDLIIGSSGSGTTGVSFTAGFSSAATLPLLLAFFASLTLCLAAFFAAFFALFFFAQTAIITIKPMSTSAAPATSNMNLIGGFSGRATGG